MARGYNLNPELQRKIEDERAGRLDFVYETDLSPDEAMKRLGRTVPAKLSSYEFKRENGVLYMIFTDDTVPNDGLHYIKPMKYAVRFESEGQKTIIRVRYIWEDGPGNDPYLFPGDVDDFFCKLFDARVSGIPKKIWIDGTDTAVAADPLKIHGSKYFWIISAIFIIIWLVGMSIDFIFSSSKDEKTAKQEPVQEIKIEEKAASEPGEAKSFDAPELTEPEPAEDDEVTEEISPLMLWEYDGYVDECAEYTWRDEFVDCDYDGDGLNDRLGRKWNCDEQTAIYTIEFGNGDTLTVPQGWETGFPHVQSGDLDGDGVKEILVTLSYDTSTDPVSFGDLWLFDRDASGKYSEVSLPLVSGENGEKGFNVDYEAPVGNEIRFSLREAGLSMSQEVDDEFLNNWWTGEAFSELRPVYWAEIKDGANPAIRCYINPIRRSAPYLGFNISYRNGRYETGYIEIDEPQTGPF